MRIEKADLDEIVFHSRNKAYGGYQLRKQYGRVTLLAFLFGSVTVAGLMSIPVLEHLLSGDELAQRELVQNVEVELSPPPVDNEEKAPEELNVPPPPPPAREEIKFVPPEVVEDDEAPDETTIAEVEKLTEDEDQNVGDENKEGDDAAPDISRVDIDGAGGTGSGDAPVVQALPDPNAFVVVDKQPQAANMDDIKKKMVYPEIARQANIEGRVILKVLINEEGTPIKHIVLKSPHPSLAAEASSKVYLLQFSPAIQAGRPIKFWVVTPFDFKL